MKRYFALSLFAVRLLSFSAMTQAVKPPTASGNANILAQGQSWWDETFSA